MPRPLHHHVGLLQPDHYKDHRRWLVVCISPISADSLKKMVEKAEGVLVSERGVVKV